LKFRRHRAKANNPVYNVQPETVKLNSSAIEAVLESPENKLKLILALLEDSRIRLLIDEIEPIRKRFHPVAGLDGEPKQQKFLLKF
jgi:hypothetical protein